MPFIEHDGCKLFYETSGSGVPLVLLHGLGADSASWLPVKERLSADFTLILTDNRFTGRSECTPSEATVKHLAGDLKAVLDALGIDKAVVAGHSMGGYVAQQFALDYPESVSALILEGTSISASNRNKALFELWAEQLRQTGYTKTFWKNMFPWLLSPVIYEEMPDFVQMAVDAANGYKLLPSPENFCRQVEMISQYVPADRIKNIKCRTLVLSGEMDMLMLAREGRLLADLIPGAQFVSVPRAGHVIHSEQPEVFIRALKEFIKV